MKNVFRIGEIAALYGIGTDSLRYYEEKGLVIPHRAANGYRMYSIEDIWRLNVLRDLRALGFSLERIKEYLEDRSIDSTLELLMEEKQEIQRRIQSLEKLHSNVERRMATIADAQARPLGQIIERTIEERRCHRIWEDFSTDEEADVLMKRLINRDPERLYLIGNSNIGFQIPLGKEKGAAYCAAFLVDERGDDTIDEGLFLCLRYRGAAQAELYARAFSEYARKHALQLADYALEFIHIDIHEASDFREHITEIQIPAKPF